MMMDDDTLIGWLLIAFVAAVGILFGGGCAPKYIARPLEVIRPCLDAAPPKRAIVNVYGSQVVEFADAEGAKHVAVNLLADPETLKAFFAYVESLERIASSAAGCRR